MKKHLLAALCIWSLSIPAIAQTSSVGGMEDLSNLTRDGQIKQIEQLVTTLDQQKEDITVEYDEKMDVIRDKIAKIQPNACSTGQKLHWEGDRWVCLSDSGCEPKDCVLTTTPATQSTEYAWHVDYWSICNNGIQARTVSCKDSNTQEVSESYCTSEKPATEQNCIIVSSDMVVCQGKSLSSGQDAYCIMDSAHETGQATGSCSTSSSSVVTQTLVPGSASECSYVCSNSGNWLVKENNCQGL